MLMYIEDDDAASDSSQSDYADIDPEDPMRDYLIAQRKEAKALKRLKIKGKSKHKNETPEERWVRKERKRDKKLKKRKMKSDGVRGVEDLLNELESMDRRRHAVRRRSPSRRSPGDTSRWNEHNDKRDRGTDYRRTPPRRTGDSD